MGKWIKGYEIVGGEGGLGGGEEGGLRRIAGMVREFSERVMREIGVLEKL